MAFTIVEKHCAFISLTKWSSAGSANATTKIIVHEIETMKITQHCKCTKTQSHKK